MKTRIIVAVICVPLIFILLFYLPPVATAVLISGISVIGSYELLKAVGSPSGRRLYVYSAVSAVAVPVSSFILGPGALILRADLVVLLAVLFGDAVLSYKTARQLSLAQLAAALFGGFVIPFFLTSIVTLRLFENGRYYVLIPFIIAFITDGGAYFTGVFFGKHRPFPNVSPKKTAEGCIGGIMTGIAGMAVFGVILSLAAGLAVNFWALAAYGLVAGVVTELGDLAFSLVKREFSIKDYGNLIPGHGGILDRFDSMIFAAPVIYLFAVLFPAI